jgi:hypothetical protein
MHHSEAPELSEIGSRGVFASILFELSQTDRI